MLASPLLGQAIDEPIDGMVQGDADNLPPVQIERFNALLKEIQTGDYFAGRTAVVSFQGKTWKIDRSLEAVKMKTPGNPPSRLESLGELMKGLNVDARGSFHIDVQREFNADGTLKSEHWSIDVGGQWQVKTGMDDAQEKSHKSTTRP